MYACNTLALEIVEIIINILLQFCVFSLEIVVLRYSILLLVANGWNAECMCTFPGFEDYICHTSLFNVMVRVLSFVDRAFQLCFCRLLLPHAMTDANKAASAP